MDYHERLEEAAQASWESFGFGPDDVDLVELHDATSPEELYSASSAWASSGWARPAGHRGRGHHLGGRAVTVNTSGGLVGRGIRWGPPAWPRRSRSSTQLRGRAGDRQVPGARIGVAVNTGGGHRGRRGVRGHPRHRCRAAGVPGASSSAGRGWRSRQGGHQRGPVGGLDTNDAWITERTGIRERRWAAPRRSWPSRPASGPSSTPGVGPERHRPDHLGHDHARRHRCRARRPPSRRSSGIRGRGLRPERRLLGLRLRPWWRRPACWPSGPAGAL